jgi:hypothetical protein
MVGEKGYSISSLQAQTKQSRAAKQGWIASSLTLLAMAVQKKGIFDGLA